ncbi:MAG: hypothetical protein Q4D62_09520 [Planctomycetia bacterium]|nr:hypothetical protein [Planctomycetia bacterium]
MNVWRPVESLENNLLTCRGYFMKNMDAYSYCPGGTGKKIKFCCANRMEDFKKIYKLLDAEQYAACLNYIDQLLEKDADRACLLALRCGVLGASAQTEIWSETAKRFYELYPDNPIALAESAAIYLTEEQKKFVEASRSQDVLQKATISQQYREDFQNVMREVVRRLEQAFCNSQSTLYEQVLDKMPFFVRAFLATGLYESAIAWMTLLLSIEGETPQLRMVARMLQSFYGETTVPLCLRTGLSLKSAPSGVAWQGPFEEIRQRALKVHWTEAVEAYETLVAEQPEVAENPTVWFNLAVLSEWRCDLCKAQEYWKKYLSFTEIPFYEALEIQIRLGFLKPYPLEDALDVCSIQYTLTETDGVMKSLLSNLVFQQIPDPTVHGQHLEGLLAAFELYDSPRRLSWKEMDIENIPVVTGTVLLWGRQTDKEPRLEIINVLQSSVAYTREEIEASFQDYLVGEPKIQKVNRVSVSVDSFVRRINIPREATMEEIQQWRNAHFQNVLLNHWIHFPLGVLDRQSMEVAAKKPEYRIRVEAVLYFVKFIARREGLDRNCLNLLRERLGLPAMPSILEEDSWTLSPLFYDQLQSPDWAEPVLERLLLKATIYRLNDVPVPFLEAVARREGLQASLRVEAWMMLIRMYPTSEKVDEWIQQGRVLCEKEGLDEVVLDVLELNHAMESGKLETVLRLIRHIRQEHKKNTDIQQYVTQLESSLYHLMSPESSPVAPPMPVAAAGNAAPATPKLWTPDAPSENTGEGKSGLWLPD